MKKLSNLVILTFLWLLVLSMIVEEKGGEAKKADNLKQTENISIE